MKAFVFAGPTLGTEHGRSELEARYLPPVSLGDVYRASLERPWAIGIVDGYFERMPAVWHKEILWALSRGIHVLGSASMGALRAAELEPFGMEGVGRVFESFRTEELEDDDEVTVVHGTAETGYRPLSEAMVNIRFTLRAAQRESIISGATRRALTSIAKTLFYPRRDYPTILRRGAAEGLSAAEIGRLKDWLPAGRVDQKRADAIAMLRRMAEIEAAGAPPKTVRFTFQHTELFEQVRRECAERRLDVETETQVPLAVLDELRLTGDYARARARARSQALALEIVRSRGGDAEVGAVAPESAMAREYRVLPEEERAGWLRERGLNRRHLERFLADEARAATVIELFGADVERCLVNRLRVTGRHRQLAARAAEKHRLLARRGLENPGLADAGWTEEEELWRWYFEACLDRPRPADLDAYARDLDYSGRDDLRREVLREYLYLETLGGVHQPSVLPRERSAP